MGLGPLATYVPPGVYTRTLTESNVAAMVAGLRIPVLIGVGQEELEQNDLEMVRGSSATIDQQIVKEDVTLSYVLDETNPSNPVLGATDGTKTKVRVRNFPIVDGQGFGRVTNDIRSVTVTVNGVPVAVGSVNGSAGYVTLQIPPNVDDDVRVSYYFHRGDTSFTDDLSDQVTSGQAFLTSPGYAPFSVVAGLSDVFLLQVNGIAYQVKLTAGTFTAAGLKSQIDVANIPGLSVSVFTDNLGQDHLQFNASISVTINDGNANGPLGFTSGTTTSRNKAFQVYNRPIVDGSSGGITTTDPSKVVVKVDGLQVIPSAVDGRNGVVTLPYAPASGSQVLITYWANTWQDTFDYLPNTLVTQVTRCGLSAGRSDYIEGVDFVISNPSADTSIVHWGTSYVITAGTHSPGAELFDSSQIATALVDDKIYNSECTRVINTAVVPAVVSSTEFLLGEVPTMGNGRDTPLGTELYSSVVNSRSGLNSSRPDLIVIYTGRTLRDALNRPAATVVAVDPVLRKVTLKDPVPPDHKAFATFWYNRIEDTTFVLTCKVPGPVGTGQYEALSTTSGLPLYQVRFGSKGGGLSEIVQWPRGSELVPDAFHHGGEPVSEIVTVTFSTAPASNAVFTIKGAAPYSFYSPTSATWATDLNGATVSTNLLTPRPAWLVGSHVTPIQTGLDAGKIAILASPDNVLNLVVDGVDIAVAVTAGNRSATQIVADINAAIDADPAFSGTAPNALAGYVQIGGPGTGDILFYVKSYSTPSVLPAGFDNVATVTVKQGTVESTLGFATFQSATGSSQAINKPATLLGTKAGNFSITAGLNDVMKIRVNGVDYTLTLPNGSSVTPAAIVAAINAVPGLTSVASVGTGPNLNKIRLTSSTNADNSSIVILGGSCNDVLGFNQNDYAGQVRVTAQEVVDSLNSSTGFIAGGGIAYVTTTGGNSYVTIESTLVGAASSSVGFANVANSAFNRTTGTNVLPGTDGDVGEDPYDRYQVTSNNPLGSSGWGIPGQTYTDSRTGLRFSVLPCVTGTYGTGFFTLEVSPTFQVNPAVPTYAFPGLETIVSNTVNIGLNDTSNIQTFNPSGAEPAIGDFYYISYRYMKQDWSTRIFQQFKAIEANFGKLSAENRVTLGAYLAILNGAMLVGIKQVQKVTGTNQASDRSFVEAIKELEIPLPGNIKPDILVPLATSTAVYAYLTQHCEIQSGMRQQSERMGFIGFASGTVPTSAQAIARGLNSNRIIAVYPDSEVITLTNELGESYESLVDGSFAAAALAGAACSPAVDVATPYTRRRIQGFTRLPRIMDPIEANQTAVAGITIFEDLDPIIRIRQGFTTNMSSVLTRLPTVTQISDFVQQQTRYTLDSFVGVKFLGSKANDVRVAVIGMFRGLVQAEIVGAWAGVSAVPDPLDVTTLDVEAYYSPIFPLLYLLVQYNLRTKI